MNSIWPISELIPKKSDKSKTSFLRVGSPTRSFEIRFRISSENFDFSDFLGIKSEFQSLKSAIYHLWHTMAQIFMNLPTNTLSWES